MIRLRAVLAYVVSGALALSGAGPQIKVALGHASDVNVVAFSPDGRLLVSGSEDKTLKVWETATGREIRTLPGETAGGGIRSAAVMPDGVTAIAWGYGESSRALDLATGEKVVPWYVSGKAARASHRAILSGDGGTLLVIAGLEAPVLEMWDVATRTRLRVSPPNHPATGAFELTLSRDGRYLVSLPDSSASKPGTAMTLWDLRTWRKVAKLSGHALEPHSVAFTPDGTRILTGSEDKTLKLWEVPSGRLIRTFEGHIGAVRAVAVSPDGLRGLSGGYDNSLKLWDLRTGELLRTFHGHTECVLAVAFSPDGRLAASGGYDHSVRLWDLETGQAVRVFAGHSGFVKNMVLGGAGLNVVQGNHIAMDLPPGDFLGRRYTRGLLFRMNDWALPSGQMGSRCPDEVEVVAYSPDGRTCLTAAAGLPLALRDGPTGRRLRTFQPGQDYYPIDALAFAEGGAKAVTAASRRPIKVWDVASGRELRSIPPPEPLDAITVFSPDGSRALWVPTFTNDDKPHPIPVLDIATGRTLATLKGIKPIIACAAFTPDGATLVTGDRDKNVRIWDVASGRCLKTLAGHRNAVLVMALSPDGKVAYTGDDDGAILSWNLATGALLHTLTGHASGISALVASRDGRTLYSGSSDGTLRIWDASAGAPLATSLACDDGEWLTWTPEGEFQGSAKAAHDYVYIVDGLRTMAIDQAYGSLYRPDRVQARLRFLADDLPRVSLGERLQGGAAPTVEISAPAGSDRNREILVRVKDGGGGVGRVVLYLDGAPIVLAEGGRGVKVQGTGAPSGAWQEFRQTVTLHPGSNLVEASAFNGPGALESVRAGTVLTWAGKGRDPDLFILAVAIDAYRDGDLRLKYPLADARSLAEAVGGHTRGLFGKTTLRTVYDAQATRAGIEAAFNEAAAAVGPDDVFLLYLAGHGVANEADGDYYYLPVDFRFTGKEAIAQSGISKRFIVDNLAKIRASKSIVLFDTCNSGAFIAAGARGISEKTAVDRLKRAMGRATVVASANDQSAMEGYEGHGVFTWALLEGLSGKADANRDGFITVSELTSYIENIVPEITYRKWGYEQIPQKELPREDFPIARIKD